MTTNTNKISIIGLGQMGRKMAQLYADAGFEVTVWNRTPNKAADLKPVTIANSLLQAIVASPISLICVYDNKATLELLNSIDNKGFLAERTIVNLTTGSPAEATEIEALIAEQRGHYINGAIQVAPDQMGLADTTILVSGNGNAYLQNKVILTVLGGNVKFLGENAAASSAMDLATLTWLYGSYVGLMYGTALSRQYGLKLKDFSEIVQEVTPGYTEFFKHEIDMINQENYGITQSPLPISVSATQRIADSFKALEVRQEFPALLAKLLNDASKKGLDNEELAAIIKVIEKTAVPAA